MTIPTYLPYFIATGTVAVIITILYGLNRALADAHWPAADRTRTLRVSALILLGWLGAAITLGAMGVYHIASGDRPTIQYGILLPILIGALMIWRSEATKRVIAAVPQQWLVGVQLYRALGAIFLTRMTPRVARWRVLAVMPEVPESSTNVGCPVRLRKTISMFGRNR